MPNSIVSDKPNLYTSIIILYLCLVSCVFPLLLKRRISHYVVKSTNLLSLIAPFSFIKWSHVAPFSFMKQCEDEARY